MPAQTTFKQRVESIRKRLGVNVQEFAKLAGISRATLYAAFGRESAGEPLNLDTETARLIAEASGHSIAWVRDGAEEGAGDWREIAPRRALSPELRAARKQALKLLINEDLDPDEVFEAMSRALAGFAHSPGQRVPSAAAIAAIARQYILATNPESPSGPKRGGRPPAGRKPGKSGQHNRVWSG